MEGEDRENKGKKRGKRREVAKGIERREKSEEEKFREGRRKRKRWDTLRRKQVKMGKGINEGQKKLR